MTGPGERDRAMRARRSGPGLAALALAVLVSANGCGQSPAAEPGLLVVATTSIVGDLVGRVTGDEARVEVLIPTGADPHDYAPSARQAARLRDADLVVSSGLGLEGGLVDAIGAAADEGVAVLALGDGLDPRPLGDAGAGTPDPHWWLDPVRAARAEQLIADGLARVAPGGWAVRAATAADELQALDADLRATMAGIPSSRRKLVTGHDAFGYFAQRYDFAVIGVLIPGGATQAAPDPRALAALATVIRAEGVPAIFGETTIPPKVAEALADEVGSGVQVVVLYTGSLGEPGSGADTYPAMMRTNAARITAALG